MLDNSLFYLKLTWLCLKLALSLLGFAIDFLLIKINHQKILKAVLLFLIIFSLILNFLIIKQKNTPQVQIQQIKIFERAGQELPESRIILMDENEIPNEIESLQKMKSLNIKNLGLLLNLGQLNKALGQNELSKEYLEQAKQIAPQINY